MYRTGSRLVSSVSPSLVDKFRRQHDYLRISLTEKCNLRCRYCMPADGIKLAPSKDCLQLDELKRLANVFVERCGVTKVRLTGGEPTVSRDLMPLLMHLNTLKDKGLQSVAITTNGLKLVDNVRVFEDLGKLKSIGPCVSFSRIILQCFIHRCQFAEYQFGHPSTG